MPPSLSSPLVPHAASIRMPAFGDLRGSCSCKRPLARPCTRLPFPQPQNPTHESLDVKDGGGAVVAKLLLGLDALEALTGVLMAAGDGSHGPKHSEGV